VVVSKLCVQVIFKQRRARPKHVFVFVDDLSAKKGALVSIASSLNEKVMI
jgi:hypothetical protein